MTEWRTHPALKGRFHPEYPDDLQVAVHDGYPRISGKSPEVVWVTVLSVEGENHYTGRVLNQPHYLESVREGDVIHFLANIGNSHLV